MLTSSGASILGVGKVGLGVVGVAGAVVVGRELGLGKYYMYIVFWTESILESDYFPEEGGTIWQECRFKWKFL